MVPLAVLQIPDAIAWSLPSQFAVAGPNALASLLRAASLALPAMAVATPRRWPSPVRPHPPGPAPRPGCSWPP
ncbi:MAG TPA: hypothetical protein VGS06_21035, partial [Streptosporangiaceae bacterium]|nr:hypothetical protein [Streptosporangiaceae bacterium]